MWEIDYCAYSTEPGCSLNKRLADGWEPFGVDNAEGWLRIWIRRLKS